MLTPINAVSLADYKHAYNFCMKLTFLLASTDRREFLGNFSKLMESSIYFNVYILVTFIDHTQNATFNVIPTVVFWFVTSCTLVGG
jgi:hypothetical protein